MITHKHHIIPKHAGGTDDPSNIVVLTIEEHAEAHRKLFEEYGRWQDRIAWKFLSGQINSAEATRQKRIETNKARKGKVIVSEITRQKLREASLRNGNKPPAKANRGSFKKGNILWCKGKNHSQESIIKMSKSKLGNKHCLGYKRTQEEKNKISLSRKGKGVGENNGMFSAENRKKVSESKIGRKWYHNPETKQVICVLPQNRPDGFIFGKKVR